MAFQSPQIYFDSIPRSVSHKLDMKLDSEHGGVQVDLGTIADSMDEWEGKIAEQLQLTKPEIEAIKTEHPGKLRLQTRAALQKWQEKCGPMATYGNLITAFVRAGKGDCAEAVCEHISSPPSKRQKLDPQTAMLQYAVYLKGVYKSANTSSDKFPHINCSKFINLAVVKKEKVSRSEADKFTKATLHGHVDEILKKKEPIKLEEVLNPTEGQQDMKCIFLEGAPGVGKSTCVWELCRRWDEVDALRKYSLVILVRLREKQVREAKNVEDLCYHRNTELSQAVAAEIEACEGRGVLFVLDGFDELPASLQKESVFVELIQGTYLSHCTVLVTSRPSATADFRKVAQRQIHKQIEVVGFTQEQIEEYARAAFASQPDVLADFLTYISTNPAIRSMMYIPLNCAIVVDIYGYSRTSDRPIPQTMTQLYVELSLTLLARHLGEDDPLANQLPQRLVDLPSQLYRPFYALAKLAFEGLERKEVVFHQVPDSLEHFGFMNSATDLCTGRKVSMSCSFLHLTLQEFLAAFHISQFAPNVQKSVFEKYCEQTAGWDVVWWFVAGLTGFSGIGWEVVEARRGRNEDGEILPFFLRSLYEAQEKINCDSVLRENELQYARLSCSTLLDIYAAGCCVANSKCTWILDMSGVGLGGTLVEMLKHGLCFSKSPPRKEHANIIQLWLSGCDLDSLAFDQLSDIIPLMTNLRFLLINGNPTVEGGLVKLLHVLSYLKNLQELLMSTRIGCTDVEALAHLISPSSNLKKLWIGDEEMSDECKELMFKTVLSPSSLESVTFWEVDWTDQAKKLLEDNKNIKTIEEWPPGSSSNYQTLRILYKALHKNSYLKKLILRYSVSDCTVAQLDDLMSSLATMLELNNSLEYLELNNFQCYSCNRPSDAALTTLNNALQHNHTLKELKIEMDPFTQLFTHVKPDPRIIFTRR